MAVDKTDLTTLHVEEKPYTTLINDVVQGLQNPDALAIWVYLQSKSSGWKVIACYLQEHFGIGRQRYRAAMKCLHHEGLISYVSQRDDKGHLLGKEIIVHWRPKLEGSPNVQETEHSASPTVGETTPYEIQDLNTKEKDETKCSPEGERMDEAFEVFWNAGMRKAGKQPALKKFEKAAKAHGDPMEFAQMLADNIALRNGAGEIGFDKMMPTTYLHQQRWEDEPPEVCPHRQIVRAWNEAMPDHIHKVSEEDWVPGVSGYSTLQDAWTHFKTKPRQSTGKPVYETMERGIDFYRTVFSKLAKSSKMEDPRAHGWCRISWAVKPDVTVSIMRDEQN